LAKEPAGSEDRSNCGGLIQNERPRRKIKGSGYVVESLQAALWAFDRSRSFREGALLAVNLGNDADTTGAIYGQLAGAFYGAEQIPPEWRTKLVMHDFIVETADLLVNLSFFLIYRRVQLLKRHLPYHESDHVLNLTYNALLEGLRLEDIELRRPSHKRIWTQRMLMV
jgi:hypothetical protein